MFHTIVACVLLVIIVIMVPGDDNNSNKIDKIIHQLIVAMDGLP